MQTWKQILVQEHEWLERAMAVIEIEIKRIPENKASTKRVARALDFLYEIGDKIHNQKEEQFLFPLMAQKGIPIEGGPIAVMLYEHEKEREILTDLMTIIKNPHWQLQQGENFLQKIQDYLQVRKEHIWKENDVLYPMANRVFSDHDHESIKKQIQSLDHITYGDTARKKYLSMVTEMESQGERAARLIENLSYEQIHYLFEALPVEITFVDAEDTVAYFNRLDKEKIFVRTRSVIGRKVEKCHPEKSVDKVLEIVNGFKDKSLSEAKFWINFMGKMIFIQYFPVYKENEEYMGVVEVTQDVTEIRSLQGEKRLL